MRRFAVTAALAATLAAPAVAAEAVDQSSTTPVTGHVIQVVTESRNESDPSESAQLLRTADGELVALAEGTELPVDRRVTAELADGPGEAMTVESYRVRSRDSVTASASQPTVHRVYVALMTPQGWRLSENTNTEASVTKLVDAAGAYWSSQTRGAVSFEVAQTVGNYRSAHACSSDPSTTFDMWEEAEAKFGRDGRGDPVSFGVDKHLLVVAPNGASRSDTCAYGLGTVGSGIHDRSNFVFVSDAQRSLYAHELGHNLGLNHSNGLDCRSAQDSWLTTTSVGGWPAVRADGDCIATEYDDLLDVMGYSGQAYGEGNLNLAHLEDLGLPADALRRVSLGDREVVRVAPLSRTAAAVRGVKVTDGSGVDYFVQYRTSSGRDTAAARNEWAPRLGVEVLREDPSAYALTGSYLLDPTPTTADRKDYARALPVGGVFRSESGLLTVKVTSADSDGATLSVTNTGADKLPATLRVSAPARVRRGAGFTVAAKVLDQSGNGSPYWSTDLQWRPKGAVSWSRTASRTNSKGTVSRRTTITRATQFRWVTSDPRGPVRTSDVVVVRLR